MGEGRSTVGGGDSVIVVRNERTNDGECIWYTGVNMWARARVRSWFYNIIIGRCGATAAGTQGTDDENLELFERRASVASIRVPIRRVAT